jgi:hypothetical protein
MEHLPLPQGGEQLEVLYVGFEEYDGGEFLSYPKRMKWTESHLQGDQNFGNRDKDWTPEDTDEPSSSQHRSRREERMLQGRAASIKEILDEVLTYAK